MKAFSSVAIALAMGGKATAADLGTFEPPPAVASWTGCYVGVHVGGGKGDKTSAAPFSDYSGDVSGPLGGAQAGCDYQFDTFVIGLVGDISGTGIDGAEDFTIAGPLLTTSTTELDWLATIRGRVGVGFDNMLVYATGGLAIADVTVNLSTGAFPEGQDQSNTHLGWTVGGGAEFRITESISMFGEYLYADLGDEDYSYSAPLAPQTHNVTIDNLHIFKVGANYRF